MGMIFHSFISKIYLKENMVNQMTLHDLFIGSVDAKNELISETAEEKEKFKVSFLIPENIILDDFTKGKKFYATGLKGTGKTALLRYISLKIEEAGGQTEFVLFKSDFKEEDKKEIAKTGRGIVTDIEADATDEDDYTNVWLWFFHKQVLEKIESKNIRIFAENEDFINYKTCLTSFEELPEQGTVKRLFPKLKKGNFELKVGGTNNYGKANVEFDFADAEKKQVKFSSLVTKTHELFKKLKYSNFPGDNLTIFVDELELAYGKSKQFKRDSKLIRDLICATYEINTIAIKNRINLKIISAIRSEVLSSAASTGKEINKLVIDFGAIVNWHQSGGEAKNHPLFKIIYKRILTSEIKHGIKEGHDFDSIWNKYFPTHVQGKETFDFILHSTWFRPRDVIRLLSLGQKLYPNETKFSHQVFDAIKKEYSSQCWTEHAEELMSKFSAVQIDGIRLLLMGIKSPFTFNDINGEAEKKKDLYNEVNELLKSHKIASVLNILFQIGIIGNGHPKVRFAFRGDQDLLIDKPIKIHDALYNFLAVEKRSVNISN
jgi:hypothetical protein